MDQHWTDEDVERFADGESAGDAHLRECATCANAVLATVQMKTAVRNAMRGGEAPASLARHVAKHHAPPPWWIAVAALFAAAFVAGALLLRGQGDVANELVDMHSTILASANPVDVISTDRHTVKPWFEGRLPFAVPIPDLAGTPFRLIGGRVVYWRGNPTAYLLIGKDAHRISVFVSRNGPKTGNRPVPGHSLLSWRANDLTFVAVANVPEADLEQLRSRF